MQVKLLDYGVPSEMQPRPCVHRPFLFTIISIKDEWQTTYNVDRIKLRGPLSHNINFTAFSKRCKSAELNRFLLKTLSSSSAYETY